MLQWVWMAFHADLRKLTDISASYALVDGIPGPMRPTNFEHPPNQLLLDVNRTVTLRAVNTGNCNAKIDVVPRNAAVQLYECVRERERERECACA